MKEKPFEQWNTNPARSASSPALAGRGGGIIPPDFPASPFLLTMMEPDALFKPIPKKGKEDE